MVFFSPKDIIDHEINAFNLFLSKDRLKNLAFAPRFCSDKGFNFSSGPDFNCCSTRLVGKKEELVMSRVFVFLKLLTIVKGWVLLDKKVAEKKIFRFLLLLF